MNLKGRIVKLVDGVKRIASSPIGIASTVSSYDRTTENARHSRLLIIIIVVGFLLRISTILWGVRVLPFDGNYHPDESSTYQHALYFPSRYGIETVFIHGSTLPYLMAALLYPVKALVTFQQWDLVCRIGFRLVSVFAGTASILLLYRIGRRLYDETTALLAAGFTAVSFTHCLNSAFATQDVIIGFLILACYLSLTSVTNLGQLVVSGILLGVLLGTKVSAVIVLGGLPALAVVDIVRARSDGRATIITSRQWIRWGALYLGSAFIVFAVTNPHVILNFSGFVKYWFEAKAFWFDHTSVPWSEVPTIWWRNTAIAVGAPTVIACLVGLLLPSRNRLEKFILLSVLISFYLFHRHYLYPRFVASMAPLICLFAARACAALVLRKIWFARALGVGAVVMILAVSGLNTSLGINSRYNDPRTRAARWLKSNLARRSPVGMAEIYPTRMEWESPRLYDLGLTIVSPLTRPDILVMSWTSYAIMRERLLSPKLKNWTWDPEHKIDWWDYSPPPPEVFKLFDEVINGNGYYLRVEFAPTDGYPQLSFLSAPDFASGILIYQRRPASITR